MHEESVEGNENMSEILLQEDNDVMNQVLNQNEKLQSSCENQKSMFLGLLKSWSQREEVRPRHLLTTLW